ncbi:MAG: hypothetical protein Q4A12_04710 [Eubacteriales bacterium]|nr:hypothetical protein [Eubacteriales bacterium]
MKYCVECKKLYDGADTMCTECNKKFKNIVDINEPVQLCVVGGVDRNRICGALKDAEIPFLERQYGAMGVANEVVTGYDAKLLNINILVPYSALPKAYEIAVALEVADESMKPLVEKVAEDVEAYKQKYLAENENMSSKKRTGIKILSVVLLLALVAAVVWGTDYIMELIKKLFGG